MKYLARIEFSTPPNSTIHFEPAKLRVSNYPNKSSPQTIGQLDFMTFGYL